MKKNSKKKATSARPKSHTPTPTRNKSNVVGGKARRDWTIPFLKQLAISPSVTWACAAAGIARKTAYQERKLKREDGTLKTGQELEYALAFAEQWDDLITASVEQLESAARARAEVGSPRKKFTRNGDPIIDPETKRQYIEYEHSDMLTALFLKAHKPEVYGDKTRNENYNLDLSQMNERQLELIGQGAGLQTVLAAASPSVTGTETPSTDGD